MGSRGPRAALPSGVAIAALILAALLSLLVTPFAFGHGRHDQSAARAAFPDTIPPPPSLGAGAAAAPSRIYLANDDHTDYMWAGDESAFRAAFGRMLDFYMTQAETTAWRPPDFRGRFNADGTLWVLEYERSHSRAENARLFRHIKDGDITVPMNLAIQLYGAMPAEAVIRSFLYAGKLERREGLRFPLVVPMEDQTLPGGVASLWAGCGAKYSWKGICDCSTKMDARNRPREVYHFTGPDGQSVLMKWNRMDRDNQSLGGYAEARHPASAIAYLTEDPGFLARWPWTVAGAFGFGWDDLQTTTHTFIDVAVAASNASRRVIVSNEVDFFEDMEKTHGNEIERYGASFGNEWDLYVASLGEVTARMKRGVEGLRTAEALATIASRYDPAVWRSLGAARDSAMLACGLYYEHCFGPGPAVSEAVRNFWQRRLENALTGYVTALRASAGAAVAARVAQPSGVERHLVFNPLSWTRDDFVDLESSTPEPRHVVDVASGEELPSQTMPGPRLRVRVAGVPSVGYRVVEVRRGAGRTFPPAATVTDGTMDNGRVRVTVGARGQLTSLADLAGGSAELVAPGEAINDIGADAGSGTITLESSGPVSATLLVDTASPLAREVRVTLFAGSPRVEVRNEIRENFTNAVDYGSRFDLAGMVMRHEEVGMIARVGRQSEGGDYANQNTRTDGLTLGHFVDLSRADRGVTISAWDSPFFVSGSSTVSHLDSTTPEVFAVVGNQVDGNGAGISGQGGDTYFLNRFAFGVHAAWDPAAAMRFSLEHQNPLVSFPVTGRTRAPLPADTFSMIAIDSPDLLLWALKPSEEGASQGVIARVWNLADQPREGTLRMPEFGLVSARNTTHIETDIDEAAVSDSQLTMSFARQQLRSWRLFPKGMGFEGPVGSGGAQLAVWPNPARSVSEGVSIAFTQSRGGPVRLFIVDITGALIATVLDGESDPGRHEVRWDPERADRHVPPGLYFARLKTPDGEFGARIVLLD